jgi:hypothetical protein
VLLKGERESSERERREGWVLKEWKRDLFMKYDRSNHY